MLPSKTICGVGRELPRSRGQLLNPLEVVLAALVGEPDDLERMVPFDQAVGVVVDRLAGPRQQPGGGVVLAEDQVRVGLAALQRDADRHLAERAAGQRVGPAERLRAERTWMPKARPCRTRRSSSSDGVLRELVVLDEELLELVDDQQDPRQRRRRLGLAVAVEVLHAELAEQLAAVASARRRAAGAR